MIALISVNRKRRANCFPVVISETAFFFQKVIVYERLFNVCFIIQNYKSDSDIIMVN